MADRVRCSVRATLTEDAHPGSGAGSGPIDDLVARDRRGHPVLWSTHVKGLLREAARHRLGNHEANRLFGERGRAGKSVLLTSLYCNDVSVQTRVWRSTAHEAFDNRAPAHDTLRALEYVPNGTCFEGELEASVADIDKLKRLFAEVDSVGGGRSVGDGVLEWELTPHTRADDDETDGKQECTERLLLVLRARDPLCLAKTAVPGNLIATLPYVPGRALIGALAAWLFAEGRVDSARLLTGGELGVMTSDALPMAPTDRDGKLSSITVLPAPLSLKRSKPPGCAGTLSWWAVTLPDLGWVDAHGAEKPLEKLKRPPSDLFVQRVNTDAEGSWVVFRPDLRVRLRNGRPEPLQPDPDLFATEFISEQTRFIAEIRAPLKLMEQLATDLAPVLDGRRWLTLGRGGAPVEVDRIEWCTRPEPAKLNGPAYLILSSDLLVRDEHLRWTVAVDARTKVPGLSTAITLAPLDQESTTVYGFNGTARLRRLPAVGVRRGSVFQVENAALPELKAAAVAGIWLGENTHEGFGRFSLHAVDALPGAVTPSELRSGVHLGSTLPAAESVEEGAAPALRPDSGASTSPDEKIAVETERWVKKYLEGPKVGRLPSHSQWRSLIRDLECDASGALESRRDDATAGLRVWQHEKAKRVLEALGSQQEAERAKYADFFVRWLKATRSVR